MLVLYRDIVTGETLFIKDEVTSFDMNLLASGCFLQFYLSQQELAISLARPCGNIPLSSLTSPSDQGRGRLFLA